MTNYQVLIRDIAEGDFLSVLYRKKATPIKLAMGPCGRIDNAGFTLYGETALFPSKYSHSYLCNDEIRQLGAGGAGTKRDARIEAHQIIDLKRLLTAEEVHQMLRQAHTDICEQDLVQKLGKYL